MPATYTVKDRVKRIITAHFGEKAIEGVADDAILQTVIKGADSLDVCEISLELEREFGAELAPLAENGQFMFSDTDDAKMVSIDATVEVVSGFLARAETVPA